jgi:hypothetical protein
VDHSPWSTKRVTIHNIGVGSDKSKKHYPLASERVREISKDGTRERSQDLKREREREERERDREREFYWKRERSQDSAEF